MRRTVCTEPGRQLPPWSSPRPYRRRLAMALLGLGLGAGQFSTASAEGTLLDAAHHDTASVTRHSPVVRAIQAVEPAVVNIQGNKTVPASDSRGLGSGKQEVNGMGTGVIIDPRGYIVTNLHVVQDVAKIEVTLADGTETMAKLLNFDPETDLALIKVDVPRELPVIPIGSSHDLMRGETVVAIGNPFGYQHTVTVGIVSALHRNIPVNGTQEYRDLIQTNADINPGNSGGPLVNIEGQVIGINVAVRVGAQGIGFAIPIDAALDVMADLVAASNRHDLSHGLSLENRQAEDHREARVAEVTFASSTSDLKILPGDVLLTLDGRTIRSRLDSELSLLGHKPGDEVDVAFVRDGLTHHQRLKLARVGEPDTDADLAREAWEKLGVQLMVASKSQMHGMRDKYSGGLKVTKIRPGSPAARERLQVGDVIVGVLNWQTPNRDSLAWVMKNDEFQATTNPKFYLIRNDEVHYVTMRLGTGKAR